MNGEKRERQRETVHCTIGMAAVGVFDEPQIGLIKYLFSEYTVLTVQYNITIFIQIIHIDAGKIHTLV